MSLQEQVQYAINNNLYLIYDGFHNPQTVDAVDALRMSRSMINPALISDYRMIYDRVNNISFPFEFTAIPITEDSFSNELNTAMELRSSYLAAIYPLKKIKESRKATTVVKEKIGSAEETLIGLLKQIEGTDKIIDVSKFNRETFRGAKIVDRPKGVLRTRTLLSNYPFITNESPQTINDPEQFLNSRVGFAVQVYDKLYGSK